MPQLKSCREFWKVLGRRSYSHQQSAACGHRNTSMMRMGSQQHAITNHDSNSLVWPLSERD